MIVTCNTCQAQFDDYDHLTYCPHDALRYAIRANFAMCESYQECNTCSQPHRNICVFVSGHKGQHSYYQVAEVK